VRHEPQHFGYGQGLYLLGFALAHPNLRAAKGLAKNHLGIIALFIILVYGFASVVTVFGSSFSASERIPLIYFLIIFSVLVLGIFAWLVSRHSEKLYSPGDFKNEENYLKMKLSAVASLAVASSKQKEISDEINNVQDFREIVEVVSKAVLKKTSDESWRKRILWADDRPNNNIYERKAFESMGLTFTLALSTLEALEILKQNRFAAIISDMGRKEGPREGYVLLDTIRNKGDRTSFFYLCRFRKMKNNKPLNRTAGGCASLRPRLPVSLSLN